MDKIDIKKIQKLEKERDDLLEMLGVNQLDPASEEYGKIRSAIDWCDRRLEAWYKLQKEQEQINADYRKCDSDERVAKFQLIGSIGAAAITTTGAVLSNVVKYRVGAQAMQESTREAFGMDQDKVQSRVASESGRRMFDFFFNR